MMESSDTGQPPVEEDSEDDYIDPQEVVASVAVDNDTESDLSDADGEETCPLCAHSTQTKEEMSQHLREKHFANKTVEDVTKESSVVYSCDRCNYMDACVDNLKRHKLIEHLGFNLLCADCSYVAYAESDLIRHIKRVHRQRKPFQCPQCNVPFTNARSLNAHKVAVHNHEIFDCQHCRYVTDSAGSLEDHYAADHCFSCDGCDQNFVKLLHLKMHLKRSHGPRSYPCDACSHVAISSAHLKNHQETMHKFKCSMCQFSAAKLAVLNEHKVSAHRNAVKYCDLCNYTAVDEVTLSKHNRYTHGKSASTRLVQLVHKCDECDYVAALEADLKAHKKDRHWQVKYQCEYCDYLADEEAAVHEHIQDVHTVIC